jgi:uncharacterized membrane protein YqgA involved in biofilm formation
MPTIELISFKEIWEVAGPIIITAAVVLISGIIGLVILQRFQKGLLKEVVRILTLVGLALITVFSFQVTSYIWSL